MIEEEYCIKTYPASPGNLQAKEIIERIQQVLGNILCTYNIQGTYEDDINPWVGELAAAAFTVRYTYHRVKGKIPVHMVFRWDKILPITHVANRRYIRKHKQAQIEK